MAASKDERKSQIFTGPKKVTLSREEGEALIECLEIDTWTTANRHVFVQVLRWYFWMVFALQ
jgi:hypothetical protein